MLAELNWWIFDVFNQYWQQTCDWATTGVGDRPQLGTSHNWKLRICVDTFELVDFLGSSTVRLNQSQLEEVKSGSSQSQLEVTCVIAIF